MMQFVAIARLVIKVILFLSYAQGVVRIKLNSIVGIKGDKSSYESVRDELHTGDIVLFSGRGFVSWAIKFATNSEWSHIGIVQRHLPTDPVLLLESTTLSNVKDVVSGKLRSGVQLTVLSDRVKNYKGSVAIVPLHINTDIRSKFDAFRESIRNRPYEKSFVQLLRSAYDGAFGRNERDDTSSLFCSELVAEAYQSCGLLDEGVASSEYTPSDFDPRVSKLAFSSVVTVGELKYIL